MTASRLAIRAADWASGWAFWSAMNRSLLPWAVASPWHTVESAADSVFAPCAGWAALDVVASAKAPPPATAAALTSSAIFFFVLRVRLRDMRASWRGRGAYAAMYEMPNEVTQRFRVSVKCAVSQTS